MRLINLDTADLQAFLAVAEHESFRAAALTLGISQPAVTMRIQRVETTLGLRLFHRTTRRVAITEAGLRLKARAERTVFDLQAIVHEFNDEAQLRRGRVVFGATTTVAAGIMPPAIRRFREKWPGVEVVMLDDFFGRELGRLVSGEVDFAVIPFNPEERQYSFQRLIDDEFLAMVPADHPLAEKASVTLQDFTRYPILSFPIESTAWASFARAFEAAGLSYRPVFVTRSILTLTAMVRAGLGITLIAEIVTPQLDLSGLKLLPIRGKKTVRQIGIATLRGRPLQPAAQEFVRTLRASVSGRSRLEQNAPRP
ncbi:MAG: LysR family transcriptional regulator [Bradyrhizobium sp.]